MTETPRILVRRGELGPAIGSERLADELVASHFLKPILSNSRIAFFLVSDIERAVIAFSQQTKGATSLAPETDDSDATSAEEKP